MKMKKHIHQLGTREARRRLAEVLDKAVKGEITVIWRNNVAVAAVISGQCQSNHIEAAILVTYRSCHQKGMKKKNRKAVSDRKSSLLKPRCESSYHLVRRYSEVGWYKVDSTMPYAHRIADFLDKAAVKIPYHVISAPMLARVIEGLGWTPSMNSFEALRVKQNIPTARRHLFQNLPSRRLLYGVPHMGYLASVEETAAGIPVPRRP
jgi:antitoxin (DNA-binding transcriptional repressor) of toxin-antitoxin stability system